MSDMLICIRSTNKLHILGRQVECVCQECIKRCMIDRVPQHRQCSLLTAAALNASIPL